MAVTTNRLRGDNCERDWIWKREVEAAPWEEARRLSVGAWERKYRRIRESSPFYSRKFREAGIGNSFVSLADLSNLPFTTKAELRQALDEEPPFGSNLCVTPDQVKRIYQTSGTTGAPSVLALTRGDMETWTVMGTRTYYATGIHEHSSVLTTFGAGPFVAGHTHFVLLRIGTRSVPVAPGDTERALGVTVTEVMGIGAIAPSLFGECPHQQGMHFCGAGHVWVELVAPETGEPMEIETGAVGEMVYTTLTREAMPVVRFRGGDIARIEGTTCECGRTSFRQRVIGRRDDMFIVRGVNVYPTAILAVVGDFRPRVTGRARVIRRGSETSIEPPIPVEVEVTERHESDPALIGDIENAIHSRLMFKSKVELVLESDFGEAGYKTRLTVEK